MKVVVLKDKNVDLMVPIAGRPFLEWQELFLKAQGLTDLVFYNENSLGEFIQAVKAFDGTFLLLHGTVFSDVDYLGLIDFHEGKEAMLSVALVMGIGESLYGSASLDTYSRIIDFNEGPVNTDEYAYLNPGIYVMEPALFQNVGSSGFSSVEGLISGAMADRSAYGYVSGDLLVDLRLADGLEKAKKFFSRIVVNQ